jgi:hypothetical protein
VRVLSTGPSSEAEPGEVIVGADGGDTALLTLGKATNIVATIRFASTNLRVFSVISFFTLLIPCPVYIGVTLSTYL